MGGGMFVAPVQRVTDFLEGEVVQGGMSADQTCPCGGPRHMGALLEQYTVATAVSAVCESSCIMRQIFIAITYLTASALVGSALHYFACFDKLATCIACVNALKPRLLHSCDVY